MSPTETSVCIIGAISIVIGFIVIHEHFEIGAIAMFAGFLVPIVIVGVNLIYSDNQRQKELANRCYQVVLIDDEILTGWHDWIGEDFIRILTPKNAVTIPNTAIKYRQIVNFTDCASISRDGIK